MKTAVIISGQMRTFARCLPTIKWHVLRKLEDPAFFVSCAEDDNAGSAELLRAEFPKAQIEIEHVNPPLLDEPPAFLMDYAPYEVTPTKTPGVSPMQGILRQLWHMSRAWKFAVSKGAAECDMIIRSRADLHFQRFELNHVPTADFAFVPWWGNYGGVNDRFAVMGNRAAPAWFETYDVLPDLIAAGCPFHPESLVCASLARSDVKILRTLAAEFAFRRANGDLDHMIPLPGEFAEYSAHL